ncbi:hypothetical protein Tco_1268925, partial [Tanacetum coccineum]
MGKSFPWNLGVPCMVPLPEGMFDGRSSCYTKDSSGELDECSSGCNLFLRDKHYSEGTCYLEDKHYPKDACYVEGKCDSEGTRCFE